jgi:hypothetical protein
MTPDRCPTCDRADCRVSAEGVAWSTTASEAERTAGPPDGSPYDLALSECIAARVDWRDRYFAMLSLAREAVDGWVGLAESEGAWEEAAYEMRAKLDAALALWGSP